MTISTKVIEVLDSMTYIPVIAFRIDDMDETTRYHYKRQGFDVQLGCTLTGLSRIDKGQIKYDPTEWFGNRTLGAAHMYLIENWDDFKSGDVLDVEYHCLKTTSECKITDRMQVPESSRLL